MSLNLAHSFFRDKLRSGVDVVAKELNQDPEPCKSFYRMSTESFSLLVELTGP
jgi:hypothetical protein